MYERLTGPYGRADQMHPPDPSPAMLAAWLIQHPTASPIWSTYVAILIHLHDVAGLPPAHKHAPDAEFEFSIHAVDPTQTLTPASPAPAVRNACLRPQNLALQFHGVAGGAAIQVARDLVQLTISDLLFTPEPPGTFYDIAAGKTLYLAVLFEPWRDRWKATLTDQLVKAGATL